MRPRDALALVPLAVALAACGEGAGSATAGRVPVVAAESFWGSLAAELGGDRVRVTSVIADPGADPHDYEPRVADARALASARLAIVNGAGYDAWAGRLLAANPVSGRVVLDVGRLAGVPPGGNPHQWYSPPTVARVLARITAAYRRLDPRHAAYFRRRAAVVSHAFGPYRRLIARIRSHYGGTPVGASESIVAPLARALGLRLVTPRAFLTAVSEGTDPTAADAQAADRQIERREIGVWVFNRQNTTPDVKRLNEAAAHAGIPVTAVSETPTPAGAGFPAWQTRQLAQLERALARAPRR